MFSRIAEVHTDRTGDAPSFIDNINVNPQDIGHFSADDAVAGIGSAAGSPNHDAAGSNSGAAYVFAIFGTDCNSNSMPDVCEAIVAGDFDADGHFDLGIDLGHAAGDTVLREFGRRIQTVLRPEDTVSRLQFNGAVSGGALQ